MNSDPSAPFVMAPGRAAQLKTYEERLREKAQIRIALQDAAIAGQVWQSCLNCEHWEPQRMGFTGCDKFKAMPPPHVIVRGCPDHEFDIPF